MLFSCPLIALHLGFFRCGGFLFWRLYHRQTGESPMGENSDVLEQTFEWRVVLGLLDKSVKGLCNGLRVVVESDNLSLSLFVDARNHGNNLWLG